MAAPQSSCRFWPFAAIRALLWCGMTLVMPSRVVWSADEKPAPSPIEFTDKVPYGLQPIDYLGKATADAGRRLNGRLKMRTVQLEYRQKNGYLRALLDALEVPVESQLLVFSKTALNQKLVNPQNPRAVYFNDEVTVGWVPGAASIELTAIDPLKGPIFYTLLQSPEKPPRLQRESRCLACHAGTTTLQVPGLMVRSFLTDKTGKPIVGYSRTTHDSELKKRWGGWYVTGKHGTATHTGNVFGKQEIAEHKHRPALRGNITDLSPFISVGDYESPHSDIVAHLVLDHQLHGLNLLHRAGHETRLGRRSDVEERLIRYLLFVDEPPLTAEVRGTSGYARWFAAQKPRDGQGRSLREFDLKTRLFKHRLSYLIYSPSFDGLPGEVKERLYRRLWDILMGKDKSPDFNTIPAAERSAIIEIVRATKAELPEYWRQHQSNP
jgi:hypothetical protein